MRDKITEAISKNLKISLSHYLRVMAILGLSAVLSACGDNPETKINLAGGGGSTSNSIDAGPLTDDARAFKLNVYDPLKETDRCGTCHGTNGSAIKFVDQADFSAAYSNAITLVDLNTIANSQLVTQVGNGHNCWIQPVGDPASNAECAAIITTYINAWKNGTGDVSGRAIVLTPPTPRDPGDSKSFPVSAQDNGANSFANTVHPLLTQHCAACHSDTSSTPRAPFFAGDDVNAAYDAAKSTMNLDTPASSRLVLRLDQEQHNCWSNECSDDAADMQAAINAFSGAIQLTQVDPSLVTSKALTLADAVIASGGSRFENNVIALWEFKEGEGTTAFDTSGVAPALNLRLSETGSGWVLGYGVEITSGNVYGNTDLSKKLYDFIKASGEYSLEAWVIPANVTQEDASIMTYSSGGAERNFTMGQTMYNYDFINLSTDTNGIVTDGTLGSKYMTDPDDEDLQATLQHVVMTFDGVNGRQIFVNGVNTAEVTGEQDDPGNIGGSLNDWNDSSPFLLGNEPGGNGLWEGKIRLAAIHNRALSLPQIQMNFAAGVGQKYLMLFSVADRIGVPDSYIMFEVEIFDNHSYLFNVPKFINLNEDWTPSSSIPIKGMRIGINGKEAVAGQAYGNLDVTVNAGEYTVNGQLLSGNGTIIALEKGPESDEFFLTFELLGGDSYTRVEPSPVPPIPGPDAEAVADVGVRTFDEINATMAKITNLTQAILVDLDTTPYAAVKDKTAQLSSLTDQQQLNYIFSTYRQGLPSIPDIGAYLSSNQMATAQLAMKYCDVLVNDTSARNAFFPDFSFAQTAGVAFGANEATSKTNILNPLLNAIMNVDTVTPANNLQSQPDESVIRNMLGSSSDQDLDGNLTGDSYQTLMHCMTRCAVAGAEGITNMPKCAIYGVGQCSAQEGLDQNTTERTEQVVKATCAAMLGSAVMLIQ